ncbi:MAG: hypothetical protein H7832_09340 [Magnetococcus sp. DMHC-6]
MTAWNLIIVLCFSVLYMGIALVYVQLRRLRDEMRLRTLEPKKEEVEVEEFGSRQCAETILRRLTSTEERLNNTLQAIEAHLQPELEAIRVDLGSLSRHTQQSVNIHHVEAPIQASSTQGNKVDAYREARLLLSNGVDEDRVVDETGLTVEEVSLLKRMSSRKEVES